MKDIKFTDFKSINAGGRAELLLYSELPEFTVARQQGRSIRDNNGNPVTPTSGPVFVAVRFDNLKSGQPAPAPRLNGEHLHVPLTPKQFSALSRDLERRRGRGLNVVHFNSGERGLVTDLVVNEERLF